MLKLLGAAPFHHVSHPGKGATSRLRQALEIALRHRRIIASARREQSTVAVNQTMEVLGNCLDQRSCQRSVTNTVTRRTASIIRPKSDSPYTTRESQPVLQSTKIRYRA
jgi:hypothetical protein